MAWFGGSNWSQMKSQLTNITKDLLTETVQETEDPETELAVTKSRLQMVEAQNSAMRDELEQISTRIQTAELQSQEEASLLKESQVRIRVSHMWEYLCLLL